MSITTSFIERAKIKKKSHFGVKLYRSRGTMWGKKSKNGFNKRCSGCYSLHKNELSAYVIKIPIPYWPCMAKQIKTTCLSLFPNNCSKLLKYWSIFFLHFSLFEQFESVCSNPSLGLPSFFFFIFLRHFCKKSLACRN